jgi:hypothetical protein
MKTLLVWALLAVIPASSLRIICISAPQSSDDEAALTSADVACQTICSKQAHAASASRCLLVEDLSCAYAIGMPIAVLPATVTLSFVRTVERLEMAAPATYPVPALDRTGPPPKA